MSTALFLNFLRIRMDPKRTEGLRFNINVFTPDNSERFIIELENATLTNIQGFQAPNPDLVLTIDRSDLEAVMGGTKTIEEQTASGRARLEGDPTVLGQLASLMVAFDPRFKVLPGTRAGGGAVSPADALQAAMGPVVAEQPRDALIRPALLAAGCLKQIP